MPSPHLPRRAVLSLAAVLLSAGLLAACGGSGSSTTTTTAGGGGAGKTSTNASTTSAPAATDTVAIKDFAFSPGTIEVPAGTTVTWTNEDSSEHTVTSDDGSPSTFDSGRLSKGDTFQMTFDQPGTYAYHCSIHSYMKGTVIVTG